MVSAFSLCILTIGIAAVSSQVPVSSDGESLDTPVSERRTFAKGKPKFIPLIKKHKKVGGLLPHVFGKTHYAEVPVIQEAPVRPLYKYHRYQGIEVKPVADAPVSAPEHIIETHSHHGDFSSGFSSDHFSSEPVFSSGPSYPEHVFSAPEPSFSAPHPPSFAPLPSLTPIKTIFQLVPVSSPQIAPVFQPIPFSIPSVSLARPAPAPAPSPAPIFPSLPIKFQAPIFHQLPAPAAPIAFSHPLPAPAPAPVHFPVLPSSPPAFSALPAPSPTPIIPSLPALPTPAPSLGSVSISSGPEPEFPYPPSGVPIPSYIKDISLSNIDTKEATLPTPEPVEIHHAINDDSKHFDHVLGGLKPDAGFFQKIKGWKADKATAALNQLNQFKHKPVFQPISIPHNKLPLELPTPQPSAFPTFQFPAPAHPVFFPPAPHFFPGAKYENFPPNTLESPPLFNSYGVPIPHDTYAPHDRLAPAASEEDPAVLPPPSSEQKQPEQPQNTQPQFQPQALISQLPTILPGDNKTVKEEIKASQQVLPEQAEPETTGDNVASNYSNHKE